jgi:hypothetical protein
MCDRLIVVATHVQAGLLAVLESDLHLIQRQVLNSDLDNTSGVDGVA